MDVLKYLPGRLVPPAECLWMHERTKRVDRSTHGQWSADRATFPLRYGLCFGCARDPVAGLPEVGDVDG